MFLMRLTRRSNHTCTGCSEYCNAHTCLLPNIVATSPNIPLSATSNSPIAIPHPHTHYIPPHPQQGTPYHRYVVLLLPQASATEPIKLPKVSEAARLGFNFRAFAEEHGFDGSKGGGAHMWREVWDETVSKIYRDVLSEYFPCLVLPAG